MELSVLSGLLLCVRGVSLSLLLLLLRVFAAQPNCYMKGDVLVGVRHLTTKDLVFRFSFHTSFLSPVDVCAQCPPLPKWRAAAVPAAVLKMGGCFIERWRLPVINWGRGH